MLPGHFPGEQGQTLVLHGRSKTANCVPQLNDDGGLVDGRQDRGLDGA